MLAAGPSFGQTPTPAPGVKGVVVYQTDFGVKDGAVSEMKGVACGVDPNLKLYDLTHEIPAYNIWEASYRLWQTAPYWPAGTVFVSVVDPGVGTNRKSVVAHTKDGQYIVTPDNGTLTLIAEKVGIDAVREIDETKNRRAGSEASYTFHGRDVYCYTGARLAAGVIGYEGVGPEMDPAKIVTIAYPHATVTQRLDTRSHRDRQHPGARSRNTATSGRTSAKRISTQCCPRPSRATGSRCDRTSQHGGSPRARILQVIPPSASRFPWRDALCQQLRRGAGGPAAALSQQLDGRFLRA